MTNPVASDAGRTLAAVNGVLDGDVPHWSDPDFQRWEAGQVGLLLTNTVHDTESGEPVREYRALPGELNESAWPDRIGPMVRLVDDHECPGAPGRCMWESPGPVFALGAAQTQADDYPPPEDTTYGPLLLGPEPDTVHPDYGPRAMSPTSAAALQRAVNDTVRRFDMAWRGALQAAVRVEGANAADLEDAGVEWRDVGHLTSGSFEESA